jgi:hypothetical protein
LTDLRVAVANCPIGGARWTTDTTSGTKRRNLLTFSVSGFTVDWIQHPTFFSLRPAQASELTGQCVHTSDAFVRNVPAHRVKAAERVVSDLCWLLRLATTSAVCPFETEYGSTRTTRSVVAAYCDFRPPIEIRDGAQVEQFVHACWRGYRALKRVRQLGIAVDYLVYANSAPIPVEGKLMLVLTALENLKATWARQRGIPFIAARFRRVGVSGVATRKSPAWSFAELVEAMLAEVRMRAAFRRLVLVRNRLIHEGLGRRTGARNFDLCGDAMAIAQRYLFRLLGYRGPMSHYRTRRSIRA